MLTPAFSEDQACGEGNPSSPGNKHGIGKGLIAKKGNSANKYGRGKGMMTVRSALVKRHGIGKGLMTVWRATNPDSADSPAGVNFCDRAKEKKKLQQRQSILVSYLIDIGCFPSPPSQVFLSIISSLPMYNCTLYGCICTCSCFFLGLGNREVKFYRWNSASTTDVWRCSNKTSEFTRAILHGFTIFLHIDCQKYACLHFCI